MNSSLIVQEFEAANINIVPMYPLVLVALLPKPTHFGILQLPDGTGNKFVYEAVVLRTYAPKTVTREDASGNIYTYDVSCDLSIGDHVCFPYWSGIPVEGDEKKDKYRLLSVHRILKPSLVDGTREDPSIFMKIEYDFDLKNKLEEFIQHWMPGTFGEKKECVDALLAQYHVIPKNLESQLGYTNPNRPD